MQLANGVQMSPVSDRCMDAFDLNESNRFVEIVCTEQSCEIFYGNSPIKLGYRFMGSSVHKCRLSN